MLSRKEFIQISLEINLFFQRIMKEHMFFIQTNLKPVEEELIQEANILKQSFELILAETVIYANGAISEQAIKSNQFVTPFTLSAEDVTSILTGASLDMAITEAELNLTNDPNFNYDKWLEDVVCNINIRSLNLLEEVIYFKKKVLDLSLECKIFITLYDEMLRHLIGEAEYYLGILKCLQNKKLPKKTLCEELNFWNNIMGEHGEFIDGMLDPTEKELKNTAEDFVKKFEKLVENCIKLAERQIIQESQETTMKIKDFKMEATEGLLECKIQSIIPPLLADHVLREANHYLRVLKMLVKLDIAD